MFQFHADFASLKVATKRYRERQQRNHSEDTSVAGKISGGGGDSKPVGATHHTSPTPRVIN
jgi:hypothetical protein